MKKSLLDIIKLVLPLGTDKLKLLAVANKHLEDEDYRTLKYFLKMDKLFGYVHDHGTTVMHPREWVEFKSHVGDDEIQSFIKRINKAIKSAVDEEAFAAFTHHATEKIPKLIANNIVGLDDAKFGGALMLFAREPFHILLLGDPGTGKTEILRAVAALAPKGTFGLGSGSSGVGLAATFKGDELLQGLLPQADQGIACIDELNLMKVADRAALYNAMEKGFVSYDKGGKHVKLDARVRVLASANPKGDKFVGQGAKILQKQVPFQQALLSRFHLVFLIRKPSAKELGQIAGQIVRGEKQQLKKGDVSFVQAYAAKMLEKKVEFPKTFEKKIVAFVEHLHGDEDKFLVEVGPRTVVGVVRMAKAYARMQGKAVVEETDLARVLELVRETYYVRK